MNFNNQWHNYEVAELWPVGSVVLMRLKITAECHHSHSYLLVNNWNPKSQTWNRKSEFQLVEEPTKHERS